MAVIPERIVTRIFCAVKASDDTSAKALSSRRHTPERQPPAPVLLHLSGQGKPCRRPAHGGKPIAHCQQFSLKTGTLLPFLCGQCLQTVCTPAPRLSCLNCESLTGGCNALFLNAYFHGKMPKSEICCSCTKMTPSGLFFRHRQHFVSPPFPVRLSYPLPQPTSPPRER